MHHGYAPRQNQDKEKRVAAKAEERSQRGVNCLIRTNCQLGKMETFQKWVLEMVVNNTKELTSEKYTQKLVK